MQLVGSKLEVAAASEVAAVGDQAAAAYKVAGRAALKVYAAAVETSMVVMFEPTLVVLALGGGAVVLLLAGSCASLTGSETFCSFCAIGTNSLITFPLEYFLKKKYRVAL